MKKKPDAKETAITRSSAVEYLTFVAAQGQGGVAAVYADEDVWLSRKMMALPYDVDVRTVKYHLQKVFEDKELEEDSVNRKFRITAADGKSYETQHYNLSDVAENMAMRQIPMTMQDWETRLNRFIAATDREILQDAGKGTAEIARAHAESEFEQYRIVQDSLYVSDFDAHVLGIAKVDDESESPQYPAAETGDRERKGHQP